MPNTPAGTKRCSFCRKPGHYKPRCEEYQKSLVNPVVINTVVINPVVVNPVVVNPVVVNHFVVNHVAFIRRCGFCRSPNHTQSRCKEYKKSFVRPVAVRPVAVPPVAVPPVAVIRCCSFCRTMNHAESGCNRRATIMRDACAPELGKYKQLIQGLYILSDLDVNEEVNYYFNFLSLLIQDMCPLLVQLTEITYMPRVLCICTVISRHNIYHGFFETNKNRFAGKSLKNIIPRIRLELCTESPKPEFQECGICLSDEIDHSNMVKFNCGHEFCSDCTIKLVDKKPCCAFCRADVKKVCVNSKQCFDLLKATSIFG